MTLNIPWLHRLPYPTAPYPTLPHRTLPHPTVPYPTVPFPTVPYRTPGQYFVHREKINEVVDFPIAGFDLRLVSRKTFTH